jgi:O-antigen/teichoic acid export membrane protein
MLKKRLHISIVFTCLSVLASGLNFLYYPVIAHALTLSQFGDVQVGIAFIMQAAALFTSLNILALFFTAQRSEERALTVQLERIVIGISLLLAILVSVFAQPLASALHLNNYHILYILSIIFLINIPCATWLGSLQGNGQFLASGVISVMSSIAKIAIGVLAIALGAGAYGALFGLLAGSLVILPLAYLAQKDKTINFKHTFAIVRKADFLIFKNHPEVTAIFLSIFFLALASTIDVIASKILLSPRSAGQYAQFSTAAKIPYFAAVPVTIIMFEKFIRQRGSHKQDVAYFVGLVGALTLFTILAKNLILDLFFGLKTDLGIFAPLCTAFSLYAIVTLLTYRTLAHRKTISAVFIASAAITLPVITLIFWGHNESDIAYCYLSSQLLTLILALGLQYTNGHE